MSSSSRANDLLQPWWVKAAGTAISILMAILLMPSLIVLSVHTAWCRARLRRAMRKAWPATGRFLVRDDDDEWGALLREEWMPHYRAVTVLLPPTGDKGDASAEERLARRVFRKWGGFHKSWGMPAAIFVAPGRRPQAIYVTLNWRVRSQTDSGQRRERMDALLAFVRSTV